VILANLNPSEFFDPPGNGWVGSIDVLCHVSVTYAWFSQDVLTPTNRPAWWLQVH
jgi:hypothetical protein